MGSFPTRLAYGKAHGGSDLIDNWWQGSQLTASPGEVVLGWTRSLLREPWKVSEPVGSIFPWSVLTDADLPPDSCLSSCPALPQSLRPEN